MQYFQINVFKQSISYFRPIELNSINISNYLSSLFCSLKIISTSDILTFLQANKFYVNLIFIVLPRNKSEKLDSLILGRQMISGFD